MNTEIIDNFPILAGPHDGSTTEFCVREMTAMVVEGRPHAEEIACITEAQSVGAPLNDSVAWRGDEHRTSVFRPIIKRLIRCRRDEAKDRRIAYRLVDYSVFALDGLVVVCGDASLVGNQVGFDASNAAKRSAAAIERHTKAIYEIIFDEYGV